MKSDAVGDQEFTVNFERTPFVERYKTALIILGGIWLGALGGLVRTWHPPRVKQAWKRVAEGGFCGLVLVLLGQLGVKYLFQIEGPVTKSVLLGLCGVLGYIGVRMFERFALPKIADEKNATIEIEPANCRRVGNSTSRHLSAQTVMIHRT